MGLAQPDLSKILRGRFRGYSVERLMRGLSSLESDIEIVVRTRGRRQDPCLRGTLAQVASARA